MRYLVINDPHIGVKRQGGTTLQSRKDLEEWMLQRFLDLLKIPHDKLIILGDLCDSRNIPEHLMFRLIAYLKNHDTILVLGNHCLGGTLTDTTMSSCEFIGELSGAKIIREPTTIGNIHIVPHLFNQELHEEAIEQVPADCILLTHCNIDSPYASGDHSLNLSRDEIQGLKEKNVRVLAAHEHHQRKYMGIVDVIGNQFPSSIADCLGPEKRAAVIEDGEVSFIDVWDGSDYIELDYQDIKLTEHKFVRINGECSLTEYPQVFRDIAKLRKESDAFIVANNVKVKSNDVEVSEKEITSFNIIDILMDVLPEEVRVEVSKCI